MMMMMTSNKHLVIKEKGEIKKKKEIVLIETILFAIPSLLTFPFPHSLPLPHPFTPAGCGNMCINVKIIPLYTQVYVYMYAQETTHMLTH